MSRSENWTWLVALGLLLVLGCGGSEDLPDADWLEDALSAGSDAELTPLPDFHDFVVGDLSAPAPTRDPFDSHAYQKGRPSATPSTPTAANPFELRGIVASGGRWVALVGSRSVAEDDTIDGWRVRHIDAKSVVLTKGMRTKQLRL